MSFTREVLTAHIECLEDALTRTKRALWLARADRAMAESGALDPWLAQRWLIAEGKCRKYAEKFREVE